MTEVPIPKPTPSAPPTKELEQQLNTLKKATLPERKEFILSDIHSIITGPFEDANVTKDLQRMCQNTLFQTETKENEFTPLKFSSLDLTNDPTILILQDLFNFLVSFLHPQANNSESEVTSWLKVIGFDKYIENFKKMWI